MTETPQPKETPALKMGKNEKRVGGDKYYDIVLNTKTGSRRHVRNNVPEEKAQKVE